MSTLICCFKAYSCSLIQLYPSYLAQNLGFWVTFRAEMMPLRDDWGWKPPQTSPPIHISIYKVFEDIDMLFQGIQLQPYTVIPTLLGSDFGDLGHMSRRNDAITSWLRPNTTSNHFPHPYKTYTKCLRTLICCAKAYSWSLIQLYPPYLAQNLGIWVTSSRNDAITSWLRPNTTSNHFPHPYKTYKSVWGHWYAVQRHTVAAFYSYTNPTWLRIWGFGSHV